MYCIGLTGNIASGKSTALREFAKLGACIISADQVARSITGHNQPALKNIADHFGQSILTKTGELNRRMLRRIVFNDENERIWLENLLHPLIRQAIKNQINTCHGPYCVIEIPLLPDRKDYPYLNRILFIKANREQQIKRIIKRDDVTRDEALAILVTQADTAKHIATADDCLENNGTIEDLMQTVHELHLQYLSMAIH